MLVSYVPIYEQSIADELRRRFATTCAMLEAKGFALFGVHQEIHFPFSLLIFLPAYLPMRLSGDLIRIQRPLRATSYHLMYASRAHATYAYVYGLGCTFYTSFADGSWLVSNTYMKTRDPSVTILTVDVRRPPLPDQGWARHLHTIREWEAQGKRVSSRLEFGDWVGVEQRLDRDNMPVAIGWGVFWLVWVGWPLIVVVAALLKLAGLG